MAPPDHLRTLHYIASFFPHDRGATHSAHRLARGLRARGIGIEFIVEDMGPDWRDGGEYDGFPVRSFPLTNPGKMRKLKGFLAFRKHLLSLRGSINLVHVHAGPYMNLLLARLAGRWLKCPTIMKITSDGWDTPDGVRHSRHGWLAMKLYRRLDGVVAMTSGQADKCRQWDIPGNITVIPNGVDTGRFRPATHAEKIGLRTSLGLPADRQYLVYAGWLGHGKGTDVLFQVWQSLRKEFPRLDLLLVGNYMGNEVMASPMEGFLARHHLPAEWARDAGLHMIGKVQDVSTYLRASDFFVFPSRREGFGTVQIEAMSCGLPCVVNELPGVSCDIFPEERYGFRIPGNSVDGYVQTLRTLLNDETLAASVGREARAFVESRFSSEYVAGRYEQFYNEIIGARR